MTYKTPRALLVILDGRGVTQNPEVSAIAKANTPVFDTLRSTVPHTTLIAHGEAIGLPPLQMGNSEVGHMHLGAGRVLYQDLVKVNRAFQDGTLQNHLFLQEEIRHLRQSGTTLHLVGLASPGGVHSHTDHLIWLIDILHQARIENVVLHLITDGRDTEPQSFLASLARIEAAIAGTSIRIGTVVGRYYAMDRDERRERVQIAYDAFVFGKGERSDDIATTVKKRYESGQTDEFLLPIIVWADATMQAGDTVLFRNYRNDRMKELVGVLSQYAQPSFGMSQLPIRVVTMTSYDENFVGITVLFPKDILSHTLGEVISTYDKTQLRIAETEKYPHVTYFFSWWGERPFIWEERRMSPSPKVATYDLQPEMSAEHSTMQAVDAMKTTTPDFICLNYANPDMVGHTGNFAAVVAAVECVDTQLGILIEHARTYGYEVLIVADHGNAEQMMTDAGWPHTAHTINPVPCLYVGSRAFLRLREHGSLVDVAPTLLELLWLPQPPQMTGRSLFIHDNQEGSNDTMVIG